jgi:hypothetical protein
MQALTTLTQLGPRPTILFNHPHLLSFDARIPLFESNKKGMLAHPFFLISFNGLNE